MIFLHLSYGDANGHLSFPFWTLSLTPFILVTAPLRWLRVSGFDSVSPVSFLVGALLFFFILWIFAWMVVEVSVIWKKKFKPS